MDGDSLVRDYLRRLEAEAARLPADRRAELVGEVREHIELALAEAGRHDEATVRMILDRLGSPETIVGAERPADGMPPRPPAADLGPRRSEWGALEVIALLLVTIGAVVLPVVGPLAGLVLLWGSARFTRTAKVWVSALALVLAFLAPAVLFAGLTTNGSVQGPPVSAPAPTAVASQR